MSHYSMSVYFWVKYEWILLENCLEVLPITDYTGLNPSNNSVQNECPTCNTFSPHTQWSKLNGNQQIFWPLFHCFLGRKIIFQVEVIAYLYHLCFELPSTGNCRYPWQRHICKCDKLKDISGIWRGGLLLPGNINPMNSHYQSQQKLEILGNQILFLIMCFSVKVNLFLCPLLTQILKCFYYEHKSDFWKLKNVKVKAQYYMSNILEEKHLL